MKIENKIAISNMYGIKTPCKYKFTENMINNQTTKIIIVYIEKTQLFTIWYDTCIVDYSSTLERWQISFMRNDMLISSIDYNTVEYYPLTNTLHIKQV